MTSRDSWQQSKIYPTYSLDIVCSFRSEEHQFSQIYIRIIQKDSRNSWIFSVSLEKTSNLRRNIGNENANVMCEGEGENFQMLKSNDRCRKESVEHYMLHFCYIFGQYPTLYSKWRNFQHLEISREIAKFRFCASILHHKSNIEWLSRLRSKQQNTFHLNIYIRF